MATYPTLRSVNTTSSSWLVEATDAIGVRCQHGFALARAAFAIEEKPAGRFTIRNRTRVVQRHPKGDW
jgi:hypothetical protein